MLVKGATGYKCTYYSTLHGMHGWTKVQPTHCLRDAACIHSEQNYDTTHVIVTYKNLCIKCRAGQRSTLGFLAGFPKSHFLGWYINFRVYWYLKLDNQVVNSTSPKDKLGWILRADGLLCRTLEELRILENLDVISLLWNLPFLENTESEQFKIYNKESWIALLKCFPVKRKFVSKMTSSFSRTLSFSKSDETLMMIKKILPCCMFSISPGWRRLYIVTLVATTLATNLKFLRVFMVRSSLRNFFAMKSFSLFMSEGWAAWFPYWTADPTKLHTLFLWPRMYSGWF